MENWAITTQMIITAAQDAHARSSSSSATAPAGGAPVLPPPPPAGLPSKAAPSSSTSGGAGAGPGKESRLDHSEEATANRIANAYATVRHTPLPPTPQGVTLPVGGLCVGEPVPELSRMLYASARRKVARALIVFEVRDNC